VTSMTMSIDAEDMERVVTQLMEDFESSTAAIGGYNGDGLVSLDVGTNDEMWFLVAEQRPPHAPGHWFERGGLMVSHVVNPEELCMCLEEADPDREFAGTAPSCPVHGAPLGAR
jgi:hypothetical protein